MFMEKNAFQTAATLIRQARYTVAFSGAGISVESGVPPFRGPDGLWKRYDPACIDIRSFRKNPASSWKTIKKIFFDSIGRARPNAAHRALADLERRGFVKSLITQNIDHLHQKAGSQTVFEFHGTAHTLSCMECCTHVDAGTVDLTTLPPHCAACGGLLRPDFVFFGEPIPEEVEWLSFGEAGNADVMIIVGTTGTVRPASLIPYAAKRSGAKIIEVNIIESAYTKTITDVFLQGKATDILTTVANTVIDNS